MVASLNIFVNYQNYSATKVIFLIRYHIIVMKCDERWHEIPRYCAYNIASRKNYNYKISLHVHLHSSKQFGSQRNKLDVCGPLHTQNKDAMIITLQALSLIKKSGANPSLLHTTFEEQWSMWMRDGCKVYMDSYMASNGSCFTVTWIIFKNHLLEVGLIQTRRPWHSECSRPLIYTNLSFVRTRINKNSLR